MNPYQNQLNQLLATQQPNAYAPQGNVLQQLLGGSGGDIMAQVNNHIKQAVQTELNTLLAPHLAQYNQYMQQQTASKPKETPVPTKATSLTAEEATLLRLFGEFKQSEEESGKALASGLSKFSRFVQSKVDKQE
jgi:hypothetical protein